MKVVVSGSGTDLSCQVDPRFGRCPYYLIVDTDTMAFEFISNIANSSAHGAGIKAAQLVASKGVEAVLTGNVGPNAYRALSASSIKVISGITGSVMDAVERFKGGELDETGGPTVRGHFGTGRDSPMQGRGRRRRL